MQAGGERSAKAAPTVLKAPDTVMFTRQARKRAIPVDDQMAAERNVRPRVSDGDTASVIVKKEYEVVEDDVEDASDDEQEAELEVEVETTLDASTQTDCDDRCVLDAEVQTESAPTVADVDPCHTYDMETFLEECGLSSYTGYFVSEGWDDVGFLHVHAQTELGALNLMDSLARNNKEWLGAMKPGHIQKLFYILKGWYRPARLTYSAAPA